MMFQEVLDGFVQELRSMGLDIGPSEAEDCYRALLQIDWTQEALFYQSLACTLVKDFEWLPIFREVFDRFFKQAPSWSPAQEEEEQHGSKLALPGFNQGKNQGPGKKPGQHPGQPSQRKASQRTPPGKKRNRDLFELDFYTATYQTPIEEIRRLESLVPLLGRKMASRMKIKRRKNQASRLDYRRTIRRSMNFGGTPLDLYNQHKVREKPVIFALCDISWSCLYFSYFSLAIVHLLETYFRQVRSFAFIDEADEITEVVKNTPINRLRQKVMFSADAATAGSYTNYGRALETFVTKYGKDLNRKSTVLIFGDARTNWFETGSGTLQDIHNQVKRVYWFNPEPRIQWANGDSNMEFYARYCHATFECGNLDQLADAIIKIV